MGGPGRSPYELASEAAAALGLALGADELATLASDHDMGEPEMAAVAGSLAASPRPSRGSTSRGYRGATPPPWRDSRRWPTSTLAATSRSWVPGA